MKLDNKNKILLGSLAFLLLLSYHLAIKKTIGLRSEYLKNMENQELAIHIPSQMTALIQKENYLDSQFKELDLGSSNIENDLLKFLNQHSGINSVKVMAFNAPHEFENENSIVKTYILTLEGEFKNMLKVVYAFENLGNFGNISHMDFKKKRDYRTGKTSLQSTIHLQIVE